MTTDNKIVRVYPLEMMVESELLLPPGAKILSMEGGYTKPVLYVLINPEVENGVHKKISICMCQTGFESNDVKVPCDTKEFTFLGSVRLGGFDTTIHVFYKDKGYVG